MNAGTAALLLVAAVTAAPLGAEGPLSAEGLAPAQTPECAEQGDSLPDGWSAQSRNALVSRVRYPPLAMKEGVTGTTRLALDVDRDGRIHNPFITKSSGVPILDQAALDAAYATGRFPALPCLTQARMRVIIPVTFTLGE